MTQQDADPNNPDLGLVLNELINLGEVERTDFNDSTSYTNLQNKWKGDPTRIPTWARIMEVWALVYAALPTVSEEQIRVAFEKASELTDKRGYNQDVRSAMLVVLATGQFDGKAITQEITDDMNAVILWTQKLQKEASANPSNPDFDQFTPPISFAGLNAKLIAL